MSGPLDPGSENDPTGHKEPTEDPVPTGPTEVVAPGSPVDHEERLRRALRQRAERTAAAPDALPRLLDAAEQLPARRLRRSALVALAAAAVLVAAAVGAVALRGDADVEDLTTVDQPSPPDTSTTVLPTIVPPVPGTEAPPPAPAPTTEPPPPPPTTAPPPPLPGATFGPTSGEGTTGLGPPAHVSDARIGVHDGFDRFVLEFLDGRRPGWSVSYVTPPLRQDGSGTVLEVGGSAFLMVRMEPSSGIVEDGDDFFLAYEGPNRLAGSGTAQIVEVVRSGEFEGVETWYVGLRERVPFSVSTLSGPARLVIDIATTP